MIGIFITAVVGLVFILAIIYSYEGTVHRAYVQGYADGRKAAELWEKVRPSALTFS